MNCYRKSIQWNSEFVGENRTIQTWHRIYLLHPIESRAIDRQNRHYGKRYCTIR